MNISVITRRKHWLAASAVFVLLAVALTAGALFAANERQRPEAQPSAAGESVADATDPGLAPELPAAPPAPERVPAQQNDHDEEEIDLPPIVKTSPKHPNLDSNLNRLVEEANTQPAGQQPNATGGGGSALSDEPVLVTFYIEPEQVAAVRQFLEDNDVFIRNVGEDWIEAHVPPSLLPAASEQPGVRRVDTVIPPQPQSLGNGWSARAWSCTTPTPGTVWATGARASRSALSTPAFRDSASCKAASCPATLRPGATSMPKQPGLQALAWPIAKQAPCAEIACVHGTAVSETVVDVAPEVELYIANPMSQGDLRDAAHWMAQQGVQIINMSLRLGCRWPGRWHVVFPCQPSQNHRCRGIQRDHLGERRRQQRHKCMVRNILGSGWRRRPQFSRHKMQGTPFFLPFDPNLAQQIQGDCLYEMG